jgi:competence protein ComEC
LLVTILWAFAVISGLSPSVTRAVTMFTIIAIAINFKRPTNIYNTLAISALIILLIKPVFIFEVGFQLSYLAVFGIVSMQPKLYKFWSFPKKFWITNKLWEVLTVTITAQLAILPLSLFYFHQFPGLFFISNLLLVPCLGIILFLGILVIIFASINVLPEILVVIYNDILNLMNLFVEWVASKEQFLFKNISFTWQEVIVWYVLILTISLYLNYRSPKRLRLVLFSVIILQVTLLYIGAYQQSNELVIFHKNKESILVEKLHKSAIFYQNSDSIQKSTIINNYVTGSAIKNTRFKKLKSFYHFNNNQILIIDSLGIYNFKSITPNYILLINSPKINLDRLLSNLQVK